MTKCTMRSWLPLLLGLGCMLLAASRSNAQDGPALGGAANEARTGRDEAPAGGRGLGLEFGEGLEVEDVVENGAAAAAGLRGGDEIIYVDGRRVRSTAALRESLRDRRAGDEVEVEVLRGGRQRSLTLTLPRGFGAAADPLIVEAGGGDRRKPAGARDVARDAGAAEDRADRRRYNADDADDADDEEMEADSDEGNTSRRPPARPSAEEGALDEEQPRGRRRTGPLRQAIRRGMEQARENPEQFRRQVGAIAETVRGITEQVAEGAAAEDAPFGLTLDEGAEGRVYVAEVRPGGRADRAGIRAGDEVLLVDGRRISSEETLTRYLLETQPSDEIEFSVRRAGKDIKLLIEPAPPAPGRVEVELGEEQD